MASSPALQYRVNSRRIAVAGATMRRKRAAVVMIDQAFVAVADGSSAARQSAHVLPVPTGPARYQVPLAPGRAGPPSP